MSKKLTAENFMFGEDIETSHGTVRFLRYREYVKLQWELNIFSTSILSFYWLYKKNYIQQNNDSKMIEAIEAIKEASLFEFVLSSPDILSAYKLVYESVFVESDNSNIDAIFESEELFMNFRSLVMDMNLLKETPSSPNPEIQEYYELRRKQQQRESGEQDVADLVSSVVVATQHSFEEVANMTVIQVNLLYTRISVFKNFDVSTLFATVSPDTKIEPWNKHVDLFSKEELGLGYKEFNKTYGGLFN